MALPAPTIRPRSDWAGGRAPVGPLLEEAPGDVRFLLVHHSVHDNDYGQAAVPGMLAGIYGFHTGEKGWPDVAYNFFVDRFGTIWEGRDGSLDRPVRGDATGGSQGFALLCCFLGDHRTQPPSPEAADAMVGLLAHLADRYGIPVGDGATATFTSRGSNLHPAGATVTTPTISAHRDMSATECPGDAAYSWVQGPARAAVAERLAVAAPPATEPPTTTTTTTTTTTAPAPTTTGTVAPSSTTAPTSTAPPPTGAERAAAPATSTTTDGGDGIGWAPPTLGATAVVAGLAALIGLRRRRQG